MEDAQGQVPRSEYPRPEFVRESWMCLNGQWQFEIDAGDSGLERGLHERELTGSILVPFCPESKLSGIGCEDFMYAVWYRRTVTIPSAWAGQHVWLNFEAVDYDATVWVNGRQVVRHRGGFTPFSVDITDAAEPGGEATIVLRARDDPRPPQPRGKQAQRYHRHGCFYTRTTGIWQSVWLEPMPACALQPPRITPDVAGGRLLISQRLRAGQTPAGLRVRARLYDVAGLVCEDEAAADLDLSAQLVLTIPESRRRLWRIDDPHLYDLTLELLDRNGQVIDQAKSYAGLRSVSLDGRAVRLNGEIVFQRLVLDQGYYPDGVMTAPSDEALRRDIELSQAVGFNGARLHQKVFERRFLYHADRMGYLVWGEFADWGCRGYGPPEDNQKPGSDHVAQWLETLHRDYNHPSIIGWCPLNETRQTLTDRISQLDDVTQAMFLATRAMDTTRPVLDVSGYAHRLMDSDIYDSHDYTQDPAVFAERQAGLAEGRPFMNAAADETVWSIPYRGQPYFVSEFGGIWWNPTPSEREYSWGYGDRPKDIEVFYERFDGLCRVLLENPDMFGYCYTQLTDVYQEQNGLYFFNREEKFDRARLRAAQQRPAAIERQR